MRHLLIILSIFLFSLTIISCSSSSDDRSKSTDDTTTEDNTTTTDTTSPTVSSISPSDNQSGISITDNISVTFSEAMDTTSVTTNTSNTSCSDSFQLSSDNFSSCVQMSSSPSSSNSDKTFTVDPSDNLSSNNYYKIRVTTGVKDSAGNTLGSQYETSSGFTTTSESIYTDNGTTFKVTASGGKYYLDGTQTKSLNLKKGYTYYFDSSDSSTNSHPFFIGTTSGGGNYNGEYTSGVTNSRTTTGTLTFVVPSDSPTTLYYNCVNHSGMGGTISVQ